MPSFSVPWSRRSLLKASLAGLSLPILGQVMPRPAEAADSVTEVWKRALDAGVVDISSPLLFDVDGDGQQEIIGATTYWNDIPGAVRDSQRGRIYILRPDGTVFQMIDPKGGGTIESSVALGRLFGPTGDLYLVVGVGADSDMNKWAKNRGSIQAFRYNGQQFEFAFEFTTRDDGPNPSATDGQFDPVFSTPCLVDVDGDGVLEVFFGAWDRWIYLIKPTTGGFTKVWDFHNADTIWSSGAAADVNGDGFPELIIGADISLDPGSPEPGFDGGFLYCFSRTGQILWRKDYPEAIYSSPAIADVDGDGKLEVVVGTSDSFGLKTNSLKGNFIVCVDGASGAEKWRATTNGHGWASPAVGNVLNKTNPATSLPILQVACGTQVYNNMGNYDDFNNPSSLYLIDGNGAVVWAKRAIDNLGKTAPLKGSPIIATYDYNGDGTAEAIILQPVFWDVAAFNAAGTQVQVFRTPYTLMASPMVGDADADGLLELFTACSDWRDASRGAVMRFNVVNQAGARVAATASHPWPMFRRNVQRTGALQVPANATRSIAVTGNTGTATILLTNSTLDGSTTGFNLNVNYVGFSPQMSSLVEPQAPVPEWFNATKLQEQITPTPTPVVQITINKAKMPNATGTHTFTLEFIATNPGSTLATHTFNLPITKANTIIHVPGVPVQKGL